MPQELNIERIRANQRKARQKHLHWFQLAIIAALVVMIVVFVRYGP